MSRTTLWAGVGGVSAALLGSLCCVGPLLFVTLGVGAGLAGAFEPLRPTFGIVMLGLFGLAFYSVYGRRATRTVSESGQDVCATGASCATPRTRTREQVILWVAVSLALILWTFPTWSRFFV